MLKTHRRPWMPAADDLKRAVLPCLGIVILASFYYILRLGDVRARIIFFFAAFFAAFAAYAAAAFLVLRSGSPSGGRLYIILVFAVLFRMSVLPSTPVLSTDIYRYLWEGRVTLAGGNPFAVAPEDPSLQDLRDENYPRINHKDLQTIYPPLAQGFFALGALIRPTLSVQKIIFSVFDMAVVVVLLLLLRARRLEPGRVIIYAWNPLVVIEFSHSGHLDSLGIFLLLAGILLLQSSRRITGFVSLALSFLSKYLSAALLPFFIFKRGFLRALLAYSIVIALGYIPFAGASWKLLASLGEYASRWEFNSALFSVAKLSGLDPLIIRKAFLAVLVAFSIYMGCRSGDLLRYSYLVIGCALILSPTVYPWYVCWVVPFLCFFVNPAWLLFTGLVVFSYEVLPGFREAQVWILDEKVLLAEYVPFYFLLVYYGLRSLAPAEEPE